MKIQNLAVIFVIIILPISMILTAYTQNQIKTLDYQTSYDSKLDNATYDALKAFQLNTVNSSTSDLVNSKLRDIEAAANTFFDSISENFNMAGYRNETLKDYVPALVFTMYDGYYIYSIYDNVLDNETSSRLPNDASLKDGEKTYGLKPYIYYSCRYKKDDLDVVITYALDNYITVQGTTSVSGHTEAINLSGYLVGGITNINNTDKTLKYRGITIRNENALKEYVGRNTELSNEKKYVKINGIKYYDDGNGKSFIIRNKKISNQSVTVGDKNDSAYKYYKEADELKQKLQSYGILDLKVSDAVDEKGNNLGTILDDQGNIKYDFTSNEKIFEYNDNGTYIEEPDSNFNQHRLAIIRYAIEKNLSIAIANFNSFTYGGTTATANFQMPRLKEQEWEKILNNISIISFLQGLSIGGKMYNGYSIVTNNKNEEVVTENSIYIATNNNQYHKATDQDLVDGTIDIIRARGYLNVDFERKSIYEEQADGSKKLIYYYPKKQYGCYTSIVAQTTTKDTENIYKYMDELVADNKKEIPTIYYTALARERYSMYKVNRY